jgi:hypothetical protein
MIQEKLEEVDGKLDLNRTNKLFDTSIVKANAFSKEPYTVQSLKEARQVATFGNLHLNSAKAKVSVIRLMGYKDEMRSLKKNVSRKIRNAKKYGK